MILVAEIVAAKLILWVKNATNVFLEDMALIVIKHVHSVVILISAPSMVTVQGVRMVFSGRNVTKNVHLLVQRVIHQQTVHHVKIIFGEVRVNSALKTVSEIGVIN